MQRETGHTKWDEMIRIKTDPMYTVHPWYCISHFLMAAPNIPCTTTWGSFVSHCTVPLSSVVLVLSSGVKDLSHRTALQRAENNHAIFTYRLQERVLDHPLVCFFFWKYFISACPCLGRHVSGVYAHGVWGFLGAGVPQVGELSDAGWDPSPSPHDWAAAALDHWASSPAPLFSFCFLLLFYP